MASAYNNTLAELIEMTARLYGDWKSGTVDSGSTSTVVDDEREEPDDYFQNTTPVSKVRIVSTTDGAAPQGETRAISDFTLSTGTITISTDKLFSVAPGAGDTYAVMSDLSWDECKWAVNGAIQMVAKDALEWLVDETTITLQNDTYATYEYALPSSFVWLFRVGQANDDGNFIYSIPPDQYRIVKGSIPLLHLSRFPVTQMFPGIWAGDLWVAGSLSDGKKLRLEGLGMPSKLANDADTSSVSPTFIMFQAAALLHRKRIADPRYDSDYHKARADDCDKLANIERARIESPQLPPNAKKVRD